MCRIVLQSERGNNHIHSFSDHHQRIRIDQLVYYRNKFVVFLFVFPMVIICSFNFTVSALPFARTRNAFVRFSLVTSTGIEILHRLPLANGSLTSRSSFPLAWPISFITPMAPTDNINGFNGNASNAKNGSRFLKLYPQDNETEHFPNLFLSNARNFFFNSIWLESKTIVGVHVLNSFPSRRDTFEGTSYSSFP